MSTVSNGSMRSKSSTRQKFSAQLKDLVVTANRVLSNEKDIDNLDQILDEKKDLEGKLRLKDAEIVAKDKEITSKDKEIASLKSAKIKEMEEFQSAKTKEIKALQSAKDTLFVEFLEKFKTWDTGTTNQKGLEDKVADLKQKLRKATERVSSTEDNLTGLQTELDESQNALEDANEKLKSVNKGLSSKEWQLAGAITELEHLQEEAAALGLEVLSIEDLLENHSLTDGGLF
jgi:chromosome segregation ATPase